MSTSAGKEHLRKNKHSSNVDPLPGAEHLEVSDESAGESEADEVDARSEDERDAAAIEWDSDDLDELAEDDVESNEEAPEQTPNDKNSPPSPPKKKLKPLSKDKVSQSRTAIQNTGVLYLSRIPPKLNPTKIRQLLSIFNSPVLRIFLAPESEAVYRRRIKSGDNKKRQFTEGWVEFADKKVAKKVALMLNAERIGGRKGDKWYDDLWNLKYLPRFKWHHLTEQIAYQNASRQDKLRNEIAQEKRETAAFIQNVGRSKMVQNIERKRKERDGGNEGEIKVWRQFTQKPVVNKERPEAKLSGVLSKVFD